MCSSVLHAGVPLGDHRQDSRRVGNWREYERALVQRGDVTFWLSADAIDAWTPPPRRPGDEGAAQVLGPRDRDRVDATAGVRTAASPTCRGGDHDRGFATARSGG